MLSRGFWFGTIDARLAAVFRIGLGLILLIDCLDLAGSREAFFSTIGVFPDATPLEGRWSVFALARSPAAVSAWFALGVLSLAAFTAGFFTRISTVLSWIFLVSLRSQLPYLATAGDYVAQNLLAWSLLTDLGATWSLDAVRRRVSKTTAPALGWRVMAVHIALLYFVTARLKVRGGWLSGDGIYKTLLHNGFVRPPGALLLEYPVLLKLLSFGVLGLEFSVPLLAFFPWKSKQARIGALLASLAVQLGILTTMRVGVFTPLMMWTAVLLVPEEWIARLRFRPEQRVIPPPSRGTPILAGLASLGLVLMCWDAFIGSRVPMPAPLRSVQRAAAMEQPFDLFGRTYEVAQWSGTGTRNDGSQLEVIEELAPGLASHVGWSFSFWFKLVFAEEHIQWKGLGQWLCRQHDARGGSPLASLVIRKRAFAPTAPGVDPVVSNVILVEHRCER